MVGGFSQMHDVMQYYEKQKNRTECWKILKKRGHLIQQALACYREINCDKNSKQCTPNMNVLQKLSSAASHSEKDEPVKSSAEHRE